VTFKGKEKTMKKMMIASLLTMLIGGLRAEGDITAKLSSSVNKDTTYEWATAAVWDGGYVPTSSSDVIELYRDGLTRLILGLPKGNAELGTIVTNIANAYVKFNPYTISNIHYPYRVSVRQLSGYNAWWPLNFQYNGNWAGCAIDSGFDFTGTTADPTIVNGFHIGTLPAFGVPAAGGAAKIRKMYHGGMFRKDGAGELIMEGVVGHETGVYLENGTFTLDVDSSAAPAVASSPVVWFDATHPGILTETVGGKQFVTNWPSSGGITLYAKPSPTTGWGPTPLGVTDPGRPRISTITANGLRLIDFGRYTQYNADNPDADDPAGQLSPSENLTGIREVFYAVEVRPYVSNNAVPIIANSSDQAFNLCAATNKVIALAGFDNAHGYGELRINGEPWVQADDDNDPFRMRIVSFKLGGGQGAAFTRFGGWANSTSGGRGGFRLGEAIAYNRVLTEAERRQTIAYLKQRWLDSSTMQTERLEWDMGDVVVKGGEAKVNVPEAKSARVRRFVQGVTNTTGIVKTGAGTVSVERIAPADAAVTVAGGTLKLLNALGAADDAGPLPAAPAAHFDATDNASFTFDSGNLVSTWHDVRPGVDLVATNVWDRDGKLCQNPQRLQGASPTGLPIVDFPTAAIGWSYVNAPRLWFNKSVTMREGFIVWKNNLGTAMGNLAPSHFCNTKSYDFYNRPGHKLLLKDYMATRTVPGGLWTVNGIPCDPYGTDFGSMGGESDWVVIRFSSPSTATVDALASSLNSYGGGCRIAEMVIYDRYLSDRERRDAEAYLMKRWLGKTHPDNAAWQGRLEFAEGVTAELDTDQDVELSEIVSASSSFSKRGSGAMFVSRLPTNITSVSVADGVFAASLFASAPLYQLCADAWMHFDTSDRGTLELAQNGNGEYLVSKWYDVRMNGKYAAANLTNCQTSPVYRVTSETGLIAGMPYVDFGPKCEGLASSGYVATNALSASMLLSEENANVMEMHVVWAETTAGIAGVFPLGNTSASQGGLIRDNAQLLQKSYDNLLMDTKVDGSSVDQSANKAAGFNVVSMVVTGCVTTAYSAAKVNALVMDRKLKVGGTKLSEIVIFDSVQPAAKRKAIDDALLAKWRGIGEKAMGVGPAVAVAAGATAVFTNAADISFASVSGGGTFKADVLNLAENAAVTVVFDGEGGCTLLQTDGTLALPESATVTLAFPEAYMPVIGVPYRIIDARSLSGIENVRKWTIVNPLGETCAARLKGDSVSGDVNLSFLKPGLTVLFR